MSKKITKPEIPERPYLIVYQYIDGASIRAGSSIVFWPKAGVSELFRFVDEATKTLEAEKRQFTAVLNVQRLDI